MSHINNPKDLELLSSEEDLQKMALEARERIFLELQEVEWLLKSHAIWVEAGDKNTKKFHHFSF